MSVSLTVMTFNLHEDQAEDSPNSWEKRKDLCISVITNYSPMILCTQQGVKTQLDYLQQCLPGYGQFGISRKGSQDASDEHCTIFYDKEKVELLEGGTFWLSESPSVPGSISWGTLIRETPIEGTQLLLGELLFRETTSIGARLRCSGT
ncbi:hypothetical protein NC652_017098 [Populus alba x Populus x berolinensis]|nr:hypothetical protein NC652_017098 [Populus alba x Populus x berolinensis]